MRKNVLTSCTNRVLASLTTTASLTTCLQILPKVFSNPPSGFQSYIQLDKLLPPLSVVHHLPLIHTLLSVLGNTRTPMTPCLLSSLTFPIKTTFTVLHHLIHLTVPLFVMSFLCLASNTTPFPYHFQLTFVHGQ